MRCGGAESRQLQVFNFNVLLRKRKVLIQYLIIRKYSIGTSKFVKSIKLVLACTIGKRTLGAMPAVDPSRAIVPATRGYHRDLVGDGAAVAEI